MFTRGFLGFLLMAALLSLGTIGLTAAAERKGAAPTAARPTKLSPTNLSEGECSQLGGKVTAEDYGICNSGRFCITVDENNKKHAVCISKM